MMLDNYDTDTGEVMEGDGESPPPLALSIEDARKIISERHNTSIGEDDPLLMMVTLHQGFIGNYEALLERHNQALTTVLGDAIKGLTEKALARHLENQVRLADRIEQEFKHQYRRARILTAFNLLAALICIPVLIIVIL